jgi:hypothetical protein
MTGQKARREDSVVETVAEVEIPGILGDHTWVYPLWAVLVEALPVAFGC